MSKTTETSQETFDRENEERRAYWARLEVLDVRDLREAVSAESNHADRIASYIENEKDAMDDAARYQLKANELRNKAFQLRFKRSFSENRRSEARVLTDAFRATSDSTDVYLSVEQIELSRKHVDAEIAKAIKYSEQE